MIDYSNAGSRKPKGIIKLRQDKLAQSSLNIDVNLINATKKMQHKINENLKN